MNTFTLNGNTIVAKKIDFNMLCNLDDYGISIEDAGKKPMSFIRAYIAICMNEPAEVAGEEIEKHIVAGNDLEDIFVVMNKELEASDFFRAMSNKTPVQQKVPKKTTKA